MTDTMIKSVAAALVGVCAVYVVSRDEQAPVPSHAVVVPQPNVPEPESFMPSAPEPPEQPLEEPAQEWIRSWPKAQQVAQTGSYDLVWVHLTASWCAPCQKIKPWLDQLDLGAHPRVLFVELDADAAWPQHDGPHPTWKAWGSPSLPTDYVLAANAGFDVLVGPTETPLTSAQDLADYIARSIKESRESNDE